MTPRGWLSDGGGRPGSGSVMADGGGRPRWGVVILLSVGAPTRSALTGESTRGLGDTRDFASEMRGEKSWVVRPPNSVLAGCEMVSNIDIDQKVEHVTGPMWRMSMCVFVRGMGKTRGEAASR